MTRIFGSLSLALLALAAANASAQAQQTGLASYEATYRLTLGDIDYDGAIITAKGAMAMRIRRDCTRWQSHSEFLFLLELDNGDKIRTHTMFRQRESLDGQNINFVLWQDMSDSGRLEYRGHATIPADGDPGTVKYEEPKRIERKLPKGVEMPITAMQEIVQSLTTDGTTAKHNYFDPRAKFVEIRSIGGEPIILANPPKGDVGLVDGRSWRLRATPIPEGQEEQAEKDEELKEEEEETYTMMQVHDTGVASFMVMKSGITTINAELVEVRRLPFPDCTRPEPPELQLSENDCIDNMDARNEEDVAEAAETTDETGESEMDLSAANGDELTSEKDCAVVVESEEAGEMEDVESAPVEPVEGEPVDEATEPVDEVEGTPDEAEEQTDPETEEAIQPEITNASVAN